MAGAGASMKLHGAKWRRAAVGYAIAVATLVLTGLAPAPPVRASVTYTAHWVNYYNTNECLGVLGGKMIDETPVVVWTCNGHPDQTWEIQTITGTPGSAGGGTLIQ